MPNWCDNTLHITHENPEMMKKVIDAWNSGEFFQTMRPCPQELIDTSAGYGGETEEQQENERRELANLEKYGYKNWYNWRLNNWGTKWDIGLDSDLDNHAQGGDNDMFVYFNSAWSPPTGAYAKLEDLGFSVRAYYHEGGCAFCGSWIDGIDDCYNIETDDEGRVTKESLSHIPNDIINEMDILNAYEMEDEDE